MLPVAVTVLSDPIADPPSINNGPPPCAVVEVPDLVVLNPSIVVDVLLCAVVDVPELAVVNPPVMDVPPAVDDFDLGVVLSAIVVVDPEFVVAFSPTIAELSSELGVVVTTFPVEFIVVVTTIVLLLVVSFPASDFSVD